jgi:hypothetical protein
MKLGENVEVVRDGISVNGVVTSWAEIDEARLAIQFAELPNNPKAVMCEFCGEYVPVRTYENHLAACSPAGAKADA